jgi:hypothetical protein
MALLFCDDFDYAPDLPPQRAVPRARVRRGLVVADLPTMRWIGAPPVTFYLSPCPDGPEHPASVRAVAEYHPE